MSEAMWGAVASTAINAGEGDPDGQDPDGQGVDEMSSAEYEELTQELAAVGTRLDRLETDVRELRGDATVPPPGSATYTVPAPSVSASRLQHAHAPSASGLTRRAGSKLAPSSCDTVM